MPKWRRRQTQGTQNPPGFRAHEGSTPSFGIFLLFILIFFQRELINKIVAVVNDKPIFLSEVNLIGKIEERENFDENLKKAILINLKFEEAIKYITPSITLKEKLDFLKEVGLEDNPFSREFISKLIIIKKYVEKIVFPTIYVRDEEIENYIKEKNLKLEEKGEVKRLLSLKRLNEFLNSWEEELIKRAKIKIIN